VPPLIPVNGKVPNLTQWTTGPKRNPSNWRRKLVDHDGNVGMFTGGGIVVVDVDLYHDGAENSLDRLYELGLPRHTVTVLTGGGGRHYHYRCPVPIASGPLDDFDAVDIKAEGGMVVVPPSVHGNGRQCEYEYGWGPDDLEPALLRAEIVELFGTRHDHRLRELDERDAEAVEILVGHFGGHHPRQRKGYVEITRPGKDEGSSATVGVLGAGVVKVWSPNWDGLAAGVHPQRRPLPRLRTDRPDPLLRRTRPSAVGALSSTSVSRR
jgi:hypothetical protein